jgi:hypothetical protein
MPATGGSYCNFDLIFSRHYLLRSKSESLQKEIHHKLEYKLYAVGWASLLEIESLKSQDDYGRIPDYR